MSATNTSNAQSLSIQTSVYGETPTGDTVNLYQLTNAHGAQASIINLGAILVSLNTPDKNGQLGDIVLGFDSLEDYLTNPPYFGATIGRFGNRIANGQCVIAGQTYHFAQNNGPNHLHGGLDGFDKRLWQAEAFQTDSSVGVHLDLVSPDGDQGYPGTLKVRTTYTLTNNNELLIEYTANTDKTTIINLTNHSYFNLSGDSDILSHYLQSPATKMTPVNEFSVPTGETISVIDTPFDFTQAKLIGQDIDADNQQIKYGCGYDHNLVLDNPNAELTLAACITENTSGRRLKISTTEPGFQFYTGNFLDDSLKGKGRVCGRRSGFCIEPQHVPDAPNQSQFASTVLKPDETYTSKMSFAFDTIS